MKSDFAWEVKERGNWQTAGWGNNKIDDLARPVHNHKAAYQNSKANGKAALQTIQSKWRTEKAKYIRQYNCSTHMITLLEKPACVSSGSKLMN